MTWERNRLRRYLTAVAEDDEDCMRRQEKELAEKQKVSDFMGCSLVEAQLRRISERKNGRSVPIETTMPSGYNLKSAAISYGAVISKTKRSCKDLCGSC